MSATALTLLMDSAACATYAPDGRPLKATLPSRGEYI